MGIFLASKNDMRSLMSHTKPVDSMEWRLDAGIRTLIVNYRDGTRQVITGKMDGGRQYIHSD